MLRDSRIEIIIVNKNLVFTYLDIRYNPGYPFDKSILPGFNIVPELPLMGLLKVDDTLWYVDTQNDLPYNLATTWAILTPIMIEWFNIRFEDKFGKINNILPTKL